MIVIQRLLAIAALAFLAACSNLTTEHPIGGSVAGKADARLIGVWKIVSSAGDKKPGEAGYMFVSPNKDSTDLHAVIVGWSASEPSETIEFDLATGMLVGNAFVNIHNVVEHGKDGSDLDLHGYLPYVYRFEKDGRLVIYDHTDAGMDLIKRAVDSGHLRGTVTDQGSHGKSKDQMTSVLEIHLTSDQQTLDAFFALNAKAIFTDSVDAFEPVKVP